MILAGNVALESMGFETFGFAGGREDVWEPDEDVYWGPETTWLGDERYTGDRELEEPLGAVQMGLIYVNPEGPNGEPDPLAAAVDIRETFRRMAMNDEETVALIAGGHTFGKTHGAADPDEYVGPEPEGAPLEAQGLGWSNSYGTGKGADAITSGIEVTWTATPTQWSNGFFENLFGYEWELTKSPAGAHQWVAEGRRRRGHDPRARRRTPTARPPTMLTTDLSLRFDPIYGPISRRFLENPDELADAFARAWFKLTHRDMGPIARYLGPGGPGGDADVAGPGPRGRPRADRRRRHRRAQAPDPRLGPVRLASSSRSRGRRRRRSAAATSAAAPTARASASSRSAAGRSTTPPSWRRCCSTLEGIQAGVRQAGLARRPDRARRLRRRREGGRATAASTSTVPFAPGPHGRDPGVDRRESFAALEPTADGFRNYLTGQHRLRAEYLLLDRANLLARAHRGRHRPPQGPDPRFGLSVSQLVSTAWASASTFRGSDKRGGANGARIRLEPQRGWEVNDPAELATVLRTLEGIQERSTAPGKQVSLADLIVLAGSAAVELAAKNGGHDVDVPFTPGRTDASQEQTDADSFAALEPTADGFRNYLRRGAPAAGRVPPARPREPADPQRARDDRPRRRPARPGRERQAVVAGRPHLDARVADQRLLREPARAGHGVDGESEDAETFEGRDVATGEVSWTGSRVDLVFGSNSELRALAEVYASDDAREKFVRDFVAAWVKVMNLDRFDLG